MGETSPTHSHAKKNGGARPGAGRPCKSTVSVRVSIKQDTIVILERLAKSKGLVKRTGATPFLGSVIDELAAKEPTQEPEYLRLAREIRERRERMKARSEP